MARSVSGSGNSVLCCFSPVFVMGKREWWSFSHVLGFCRRPMKILACQRTRFGQATGAWGGQGETRNELTRLTNRTVLYYFFGRGVPKTHELTNYPIFAFALFFLLNPFFLSLRPWCLREVLGDEKITSPGLLASWNSPGHCPKLPARARGRQVLLHEKVGVEWEQAKPSEAGRWWGVVWLGCSVWCLASVREIQSSCS